MAFWVMILLLSLIPAGLLALLIVSLIRFLVLSKRLRRLAEPALLRAKKRWLLMLILSASVLGVLLAVAIAFVLLLSAAVAYM